MSENREIDTTVIEGTLASISPLRFMRVDRTEEEQEWDRLVKAYHYLGYQKMIGQRIKYLVKSGGRPVAAISYNRPAHRIDVRDAYIGWTEANRREQLQYVVANNRFLILPWVHVRYLASHLLAISLRQVRQDWEKQYGIRPMLAETFVDSTQYRGTCYKAANWILAGETRGFGKIGNTYTYHGHKKAVYLYELDPEYRRKLGCQRRATRPAPSKKYIEEENGVILGIPDWDEKILQDCGLDETAVQKLGQALKGYLDSLRLACHTIKQHRLIAIFIKGLFSDLERKSIEPIALRYGDQTGVRNMQMFFRSGTLSQDDLLGCHQRNAARLLGEPDGMINVDGSDLPKKGKNSVGVIRQHCGVLGKTDNCQAGVFVGYSSSRGYALLDRRLYMPQQWFEPDYEPLRRDCEVPEDLVFKTKNQLAAEMSQQADQSGIAYRWIGCDSAFGVDRDFLANLPKDSYYFADIRSNNLVWLELPEMTVPQPSDPSKGGRRYQYAQPSEAPINVGSIAQDDRYPWEQIVLAEGSKGPILTRIKCLRVIRASSVTPCGNHIQPVDEVWLYIREYENGRIKHSFSNAPADIDWAELNRAATMRWPTEQCFEERKDNLGMDHNETRSWQAWHLHMLLVMIAHLFTMQLRQMFKKNTCFVDANGQNSHLVKSAGRSECHSTNLKIDQLPFATQCTGIPLT